MRKKCLLVALLTWVTISKAIGQTPTHPPARAVLDVGIRFQKSISFYTENGITAQYAHPKLVSKRLFLGLSYITSRLGTAFQSNAIKQDNFLVSAGYYFRPNWVVRPMARLNVGYFAAHYASPLFDELPKTSPLASPEFGLCYCPIFPLKINGSIGYNFLTGNGVTGPGTLYPVFVQTSVTWNILKNSKN